jgi:DUF1680 family protein
MRLMIRIPGWARERIMEGNLYRFQQPSKTAPALRLNGEAVRIVMEMGYAVIDRRWEAGDVIELSLPMPVRKVLCDSRVSDNAGKAAIMRGPIVYCVEGRDVDRSLDSISLAAEPSLAASFQPGLLGGVAAVRGTGFTAIPYYAWANRGAGSMRVWLRD